MIGVCSWSLRPADPAELVEGLGAVGVAAVQLALDPLRTGDWSLRETVDRLAGAGIRIRSGMMSMAGEDYSTLESIRATGGVRPDATWPANLAAARANARVARQLGLGLVTFHAGFLPYERGDGVRPRMVERLRALVDAFAAEGVEVGFETGQEDANTLLAVLAELDRATAGINFDPANMILYGHDADDSPVAALRKLLPRVRQVHVKDARPAARAGSWGTEVPVGSGGVDWDGFFDVLVAAPRPLDLMIEREAGDDRVGDARTARALVEAKLRERAAEGSR